MSRFIAILTAIALGTLGFAGCGGSSGGSTASPPPPPPPPRSFYMGFTPWPYDATQMAVDDTNQRIQDNGDIVAHHITVGVPWEEALSQVPYHPNVEAELAGRLNMIQPGKAVFLAIDSLNQNRDGMAPNWGENFNEPLSAPWDTRPFDNFFVAAAYTNFAIDLIFRFQPLYFNYGTEISELMLNDPAAFDEYVEFARVTYTVLKAIFPNVQMMVSIAMKSPGSEEMATIAAGFERIQDYVDVVGISTYPYIFFDHADKGDPNTLPALWMAQIQLVAPGKPVAITETGWAAQNVVIPEFGVDVESNERFQESYMGVLMGRATQLEMEFVIWWALTDFDAFWAGDLNRDPVARIWRDIGLVDENLVNRPALTIWQSWYARPRE